MEDQLVFVFRLLGFPGGSEKKESKVAQSCLTLCDPMDFSSKNTEVGCHFLLQGIFLTQGLNLGPSHCRQIEPPG